MVVQKLKFFLLSFGKEEGKMRGYPGHQEIELALVKAEITANKNMVPFDDLWVIQFKVMKFN